ncbi:Transposase IS200 like protein [compost metagenome]
MLTAEVVTEKGLGRLLAVNAEADHVHVALWLPANLAGSEAAGIIKSYTSRHLRKEFPELKEHHDEALWQRGCFVGSIGAVGHLETVLSYIAQQDAPQAVQDDQEGAFPHAEVKEDSEA